MLVQHFKEQFLKKVDIVRILIEANVQSRKKLVFKTYFECALIKNFKG